MSDTTWINNARVDDVTTWPTKEDLRNQLQVTDRTIERWSIKGKLRSVQRRNPGEKSRPCYHPDDVRVLMKDIVEVIPVTLARPTTPTATPIIPDISDTTDRRDVTVQVNEFAKAFTATDIRSVVESLLSLSRVSPTEKTYLSLDEAVELSGLSEDYLKELAHKGKLVALRGKGIRGRWKFPTAAIKAIDPNDVAQLSDMRFETATNATHATDINRQSRHAQNGGVKQVEMQ